MYSFVYSQDFFFRRQKNNALGYHEEASLFNSGSISAKNGSASQRLEFTPHKRTGQSKITRLYMTYMGIFRRPSSLDQWAIQDSNVVVQCVLGGHRTRTYHVGSEVKLNG